MGYSLGFWLEGESTTNLEDDQKNITELHINYWSLEAKQVCNYLDIGLRLELKSRESLTSINFYFPFIVERDNYMGNLGNVVCSTNDLIELIFNEKLISSDEGINYKDISFDGKDDECLRFYKDLDIGDEEGNVRLIIDEENKSSRIKIPKSLINTIDHNPEGLKIFHYFRFRLKLTSQQVKVLSQNYDPQDRLVVSKFEKTEVIDFRLNELRDLPAPISSCLNKNFVLKRIDFFLIRDIHDELKLSHDKYKRCRLLEKEVWNPYLEFKGTSAVLPTQMLIYHFTKDCKTNHIDRFNAFAKFVRVKVTISSILLFIFSVIMLGALGSLLATIFIESRPQGLYFWVKGLIFHLLIGFGFCYIIFYICKTFWKGNVRLQWPLRRL